MAILNFRVLHFAVCSLCGAEGPPRDDETQAIEQAKTDGWHIQTFDGMADAHDGAGELVKPERLFPEALRFAFCRGCKPLPGARSRARQMMQDAFTAAVREHFPEEHKPPA